MLRLDLGCTSWIPRIPAGPRLVVSRRFQIGFARVDLIPPAKLCAKQSSLGYSSVIVPELLYLFPIVCFVKAMELQQAIWAYAAKNDTLELSDRAWVYVRFAGGSISATPTRTATLKL